MRKVYVEAKVRIIINVDEDIEIDDVLSEMDYNFKSNTDGADIHDTEIEGWEITDSK